MNAIKTTHNLYFEVADSPYNVLDTGSGHKIFRVGTCTGQWGSAKDSFFIMSVVNKCKGNGHLTDVFEWFEWSCKQSNRNLIVLECINKDFYTHLISKRGFIPLDADGDNCIKVFNKQAHEELKKNGNEIIMAGSVNYPNLKEGASEDKHKL